MQAVLASCSSLLGTFDTIVAYFVFVTVVFIALTVAARLRAPPARAPACHVPTRLPLDAASSSSCWSRCCWSCSRVNNPLQALLGVAVVAAALPVYHIDLPRSRVSALARIEETSRMTWIKTDPLRRGRRESAARAGGAARAVSDRVRRRPSTRTRRRPHGIVASHSLIPDALYHAFATFGVADVARAAADARAARDDHDGRLGHQPVPVLNRVARRVSASRHARRSTSSRRCKRDFRAAPISEQDASCSTTSSSSRATPRASRPTIHDSPARGGLRRPGHPADHADRLVVQLHQPRRGRARGRAGRR